MAGTMHTQKRGERTYRYYNYRCPANRRDKLCGFNKVVFENTIEKKLLDQLDSLVETKKLRSIEMQAKNEKVAKYNLTDLQAELDRLNYSWQKGRIKNVDEYDRRYDELMAKIDEANAEQAADSSEPDYERIAGVLTEGWREIYEALDLEHRRAFWRSFVDEIQIEWDLNVKRIKDVIFF